MSSYLSPQFNCMIFHIFILIGTRINPSCCCVSVMFTRNITPMLNLLFFVLISFGINYRGLPVINNYPAKSRGISPDTQPTRPQAESAKIRRYSARLSRIIVLLFNKLITKLTILSGQEKNSFIYSLACCGVQNYVYRRISVTYG